MLRLLWQELKFRRNAIIGWGLGLSFFPVVYVGIYPEFAEQMSMFEDLMDLAIYQAMGISMAGFEGYMASTVLNFIPLLLSIYAIINGTATLAGEEEDGKLELVVTLPTPRWQIVTVKALALAIALLVILIISSLGEALTLASIQDAVETDVTPSGAFFTLLGAYPLALTFGMISLFLGAFTPRRRIASMIAAAIIAVSYLGNNLAGMITSLESIENLFLFHYFDATETAFANGQAAGDLAVLFGISLVAFGLALFFFQQRDITVGQWPWQRARAASV